MDHSTATAYRGRLYVHGGYAGRGLSEPQTRCSSTTPAKPLAAAALAPTARAAHAAAVIGERLYVAGGANDTGSLKSIEVFDFRRRRWRGAPSFPGAARNHTAGVASGGRFYVIGGRDSATSRWPSATTRRRRWQRLPDLRTARGGIAAARLRGAASWCSAARTWSPAGPRSQVEMFDPGRRRWRRLPDMRTPRHGLGGAGLGNRVYAIEGGPEPGLHFSRAIEFLDVR